MTSTNKTMMSTAASTNPPAPASDDSLGSQKRDPFSHLLKFPEEMQPVYEELFEEQQERRQLDAVRIQKNIIYIDRINVALDVDVKERIESDQLIEKLAITRLDSMQRKLVAQVLYSMLHSNPHTFSPGNAGIARHSTHHPGGFCFVSLPFFSHLLEWLHHTRGASKPGQQGRRTPRDRAASKSTARTKRCGFIRFLGNDVRLTLGAFASAVDVRSRPGSRLCKMNWMRSVSALSLPVFLLLASFSSLHSVFCLRSSKFFLATTEVWTGAGKGTTANSYRKTLSDRSRRGDFT
jgi:hypothetical protein